MAAKDTVIRPPNCRIFLGNLASERTSKEELHRIFSKYGTIVEEIVMRRSFGFIQYDNPESALAAIAGENGRMIGGMRVDINLADNREPRGPKEKGRESSSRDRRSSPPRQSNTSRRRNRSPSPQPERNKRQNINQGRPQAPVLCQILYLGPGQSNYAARIERDISSDVSGVGVESLLIERRTVPDNLTRAERRGIRYVLVTGRQNETNGTTALHIFRSGGKSEAFNEIGVREAIDIIHREEQILATHFLPPHQHYGINPTQPIPTGYSTGNFYSVPNIAPNVSSLSYGSSTNQGFAANQLPMIQNMDANTVSRLLANLQNPTPQQQQVVPSYLSTDPRSQSYVQSNISNVPAQQSRNLLQSIQNPPVVQDPRMLLAMSPSSGSGSYSDQSSLGSYANNSSSAPNSGSAQALPNSVANLLLPRNTEILQSLLAKLNPTLSQTQSSYATSSSPGLMQHTASTSSTNLLYAQQQQQQQQNRMTNGFPLGSKMNDGSVQQDYSQKKQSGGLLPLPVSNQPSLQANIPAYTPQQYTSQSYTSNPPSDPRYNGSKGY